MKRIQGVFNGTGADVYLCLGGIPDHIILWNLEAATPVTTEWARCMQADALTAAGITRPADGGAVLDHAVTEGIEPYYGGDLMTTSNQTSVTYGEGIYLEWDNTDYRYYTNSAAGITGDASTETIDTWTLDASATFQGHFNGNVAGTYIGDGSRITILEKHSNVQYQERIIALTAGAGGSASEVTLSYPCKTGKVTFIGGKYDMKPVPIGNTTSAGIKIDYATLNVNDALIAFIAEMG